MADLTYLPPERPRPEPPGGATRPSVRVDTGAFPRVAARIDLDERLLAGTCGIDGPELRVGAEDLDLLLLAAAERFGAGAGVLRRQAVLALGLLDADPARERLRELALSPFEHHQVRLHALAALGPDRAREVAERLREDPDEAVRDRATRIADGTAPERPPVPAVVPVDRRGAPDGRGADGHDGHRCCCAC
ncbi:HEAT repeat domain-containing protein [Cellulomonas endophytica]|uniref:HEAT repeat domain-containing protein n=1 Tax=Cellulomonas endophytica TaxID=2494735 RepID=UPI001011C14A|nr:HEAT repeat domain-containing protein [Cellulomonas endophytica]